MGQQCRHANASYRVEMTIPASSQSTVQGKRCGWILRHIDNVLGNRWSTFKIFAQVLLNAITASKLEDTHRVPDTTNPTRDQRPRGHLGRSSPRQSPHQSRRGRSQRTPDLPSRPLDSSRNSSDQTVGERTDVRLGMRRRLQISPVYEHGVMRSGMPADRCSCDARQ